jgi:hypothetical protein
MQVGEKKRSINTKNNIELMQELGIDNDEILGDEKKIEEFIVLRAINDTNVPKLHQTDQLIFKGITDDIFPDTKYGKINYGSLKNLIESVLKDSGF